MYKLGDKTWRKNTDWKVTRKETKNKELKVNNFCFVFLNWL